MGPITPKFLHKAIKDLVVPLSDPIVGKNGNMMHEIMKKRMRESFQALPLITDNRFFGDLIHMSSVLRDGLI
jgi:hypothetical protein